MEAETTPVGGGAGPPDSVSSAPAGEAGASHAVEIHAEQSDEPARPAEDQVTELPEPTRSQTEIIRLVLEAMEERGVNQTFICGRLALSPVYFSMWLKEKQMPARKKSLYASACEMWVGDEAFSIRNASLTDTNPAQVPSLGRPTSGGGLRARGRGGRGERGRGRPPAARGSGGVGSRGRGDGAAARRLAQPTSLHGIVSELLSGLPSVAFQLVRPRRPRPDAAADGDPSSWGGVGEERSFCVVRASAVAGSASGAVELRSADAVLAWLGSDSVLRPEGEEAPAQAGGGGEGPGEGSDKEREGGGEAAAEGERAPTPSGWLSEAGCVAVNKPQRKRKAVSYVEAAAAAAAARAVSSASSQHGVCEQMDEEVAGRRRPRLGGEAADHVPAAPDAREAAPAEAEAEEQQLRQRLLWTLEAMAAAPLELRRKRRRADEIAARSGGAVAWGACCSRCGQWFEAVGGALQLSSHCGVHEVEERLEARREAELRPMLERFRSVSKAPELRALLDSARQLSRDLPDASLHRVMNEAEARLRVLQRKPVRAAVDLTAPAAAAAAAAPKPQKEEVCKAWLEGKCHKGKSCRWRHGEKRPPPAKVQVASVAAAQPQAAQPQAAQPRAAQPRAAQPQATQPQAAQPQGGQPQAAQGGHPQGVARVAVAAAGPNDLAWAKAAAAAIPQALPPAQPQKPMLPLPGQAGASELSKQFRATSTAAALAAMNFAVAQHQPGDPRSLGATATVPPTAASAKAPPAAAKTAAAAPATRAVKAAPATRAVKAAPATRAMKAAPAAAGGPIPAKAAPVPDVATSFVDDVD